jgi:hypothetical protein
MRKSYSISVFMALVLAFNSYSQGWVGNGGNTIYGVNSSLSTSPLNIGIGTNSPSAQFHTTGTLRHENLVNANQLNQVLVTDASGNVFWRDAATIGASNANAWLISGNTNINDAVNFLGTTNNQAVMFRVNNARRFSISRQFNLAGFTRNSSQVEVGVSTDNTNLTNLFVWSRDVVGLSIPFFINSDVSGMTFSPNPGDNNTLGRLIRLNQGTTNANGGNFFYDIGMSNTQSLFITPLQMPGTTNFPTKMFTISSTNRVGIRIPWGLEPTADFHTVGTVRHENLPTGNGNYLVIDALGNIFRSSFGPMNSSKEMQNEINYLKKEIDELKMLLGIKNNSVKETDGIILYQNNPNPYSSDTEIRYHIPYEFKSGSIRVADLSGKALKEIPIYRNGNGSITLQRGLLSAGTYVYTLIVDNVTIDSKKMVLLK